MTSTLKNEERDALGRRKWITEGPLTDEKISQVARELYAEGNEFSTALADDMIALWAHLKKPKEKYHETDLVDHHPPVDSEQGSC